MLLQIDNSTLKPSRVSPQLAFRDITRQHMRNLKEAIQYDYFISNNREILEAKQFLSKYGLDQRYAGEWDSNAVVLRIPCVTKSDTTSRNGATGSKSFCQTETDPSREDARGLDSVDRNRANRDIITTNNKLAQRRQVFINRDEDGNYSAASRAKGGDPTILSADSEVFNTQPEKVEPVAGSHPGGLVRLKVGTQRAAQIRDYEQSRAVRHTQPLKFPHVRTMNTTPPRRLKGYDGFADDTTISPKLLDRRYCLSNPIFRPSITTASRCQSHDFSNFNPARPQRSEMAVGRHLASKFSISKQNRYFQQSGTTASRHVANSFPGRNPVRSFQPSESTARRYLATNFPNSASARFFQQLETAGDRHLANSTLCPRPAQFQQSKMNNSRHMENRFPYPNMEHALTPSMRCRQRLEEARSEAQRDREESENCYSRIATDINWRRHIAHVNMTRRSNSMTASGDLTSFSTNPGHVSGREHPSFSSSHQQASRNTTAFNSSRTPLEMITSSFDIPGGLTTRESNHGRSNATYHFSDDRHGDSARSKTTIRNDSQMPKSENDSQPGDEMGIVPSSNNPYTTP